jgi:hypothetical protein
MKHLFAGWFSNCCPHCKSIDFRFVGPESGLERLFRRVLQPCRCALCGHGFNLIRRPIALVDPA